MALPRAPDIKALCDLALPSLSSLWSHYSLPPPPTILHITLSNRCCFRGSANVLLNQTTFPRSPDIPGHLSGFLTQSLPLSQSPPQFHIFLLISETLNLALSYLFCDISCQSAHFSGPAASLPVCPTLPRTKLSK